jgi:hypothetical protein
VLFASDWAENCGSHCGTRTEFADYIYDARDTSGIGRTGQAKRPR